MAADRLHAERDYQVNTHTELEIHRLHKKIDHLLKGQGQKLLEIQNITVELMEELAKNIVRPIVSSPSLLGRFVHRPPCAKKIYIGCRSSSVKNPPATQSRVPITT